MPSPKVIVLGASARACVESVHRAGFEVYAVDRFADVDTTRVAKATLSEEFPDHGQQDPSQLDDWIHHSMRRLNLVDSGKVYSIYGGGLENHPELVEAIARSTTLLGNPAPVLRKLLDTFSLHSTVESGGFRVPNSISTLAFHNLTLVPDGPLWSGKTFLRKKHRSGGGLGISKTLVPKNDSTADRPRRLNVSIDENSYYQEFVDGQLLSAAYLATGAPPSGSESDPAILLGISHQLSGDPNFNADEFFYCGSILQTRPADQVLDYARSIGNFLATKYGLTGLFNLDFIQSGDEFYFLELNPRYSASMELLERNFGVHLFSLHYSVCQFENPSEDFEKILQESLNSIKGPIQSTASLEGKGIWYANRPLEVKQEFVDFAESKTDLDQRPLVADIPPAGSRIPKGSPVFTVFASGESTTDVSEKLLETAKMFDSLISN